MFMRIRIRCVPFDRAGDGGFFKMIVIRVVLWSIVKLGMCETKMIWNYLLLHQCCWFILVNRLCYIDR